MFTFTCPRDIRAAPTTATAIIRDPVEFARTCLGFEPDELQSKVLRSTSNRGILNCTRQWGKSTVTAAKAVHRAYSQPDALVIVASPSDRQSAEFMRKAGEMVRRLGIKPRGDGHNEISLLFPNGSRIVGLPGVEDTGRGFSKVSLLLIDEASRVDDAIYKMLLPMLAVGEGDLWVMSTPNAKTGFFYYLWEAGDEQWQKISVKATDCPRISAKFLEEQRGQLGPAFNREYMCEFLDHGEALFGRDLLEAALSDSFTPLDLDSRLTTWLRRGPCST